MVITIMKLLIYGFRHGHIFGLYKLASENPDIQIVACAEPDEQARNAAEARLGIKLLSASLEELLHQTDIDAVAIGTCFGERGGNVITALKHGKHVICDKPICTSLSELSDIRRLSDENGLCVACMLDLRYTAAAKRTKQLLDEKLLGNVRNVSFNGQHCIDYAHRPLWYFEDGMHGGTVNDLAIHGIDLVRYLTGEEFVSIDGGRVWNSYANRHSFFKDCAVFMARLSNGAEVIADTSYSAPSQAFSLPSYWEFRFWCERGMLSFCYNDSRVSVYEEGKAEPSFFEGIRDERTWLTDFKAEIACGERNFTQGVFESTRTALEIQSFCDNFENS